MKMFSLCLFLSVSSLMHASQQPTREELAQLMSRGTELLNKARIELANSYAAELMTQNKENTAKMKTLFQQLKNTDLLSQEEIQCISAALKGNEEVQAAYTELTQTRTEPEEKK